MSRKWAYLGVAVAFAIAPGLAEPMGIAHTDMPIVASVREKPELVLDTPRMETWHWVNDVEFSPDGRTISSGHYDWTIRVWDARTGLLQQILGPHGASRPENGRRRFGISTLAYSPDGRTLAVGCGDGYMSPGSWGEVKLWDQPSGSLIRTLAGFKSVVADLGYSPGGKFLAVACQEHDGSKRVGLAQVRDAATGSILLNLKSPWSTTYSVTFSPDGRTPATGGNQEVRLWNLRDGTLEKRLDRDREGHPFSSDILAVAFSPDGRTLIGGTQMPLSFLGDVRIWDANTGDFKVYLSGHDRIVSDVAFSPDGSRFASAGHDGTVRVWNAADWRLRHVLSGHTGSASSIAFSPDGRRIASAGWDGTVRVWQMSTGKLLATLQAVYAREGEVTPEWIVHTPQGYYFASAGAARRIRWKVRGQLLPAEEYAHTYRRPDLVSRALQ